MISKVSIDGDRIGQYCRKNHMQRLSLFGSALREDFSPESDIDVLVEFEPGHTPDFFELHRMEEELSELLAGRKVDLITPNFLYRPIRDRVLSEAQTIYGEG